MKTHSNFQNNKKIHYVTFAHKVILACIILESIGNEIYASSTYEDLDNLSFSSYSNTALKDSEDVSIKNINDGISGTIDVLFNRNYTFESGDSVYGGGIYAGKQANIEHNGDISFVSNYADTSYAFEKAYGGAIYAGSTASLSYNNIIILDGNYSKSSRGSSSRGGGVYASNLTLIDNTSITLQNNYSTSAGSTSSGSFGASSGGAMFAGSSLLIQGTKSALYIKDNYAVGTSGNNTYGGALYSTGEISIINNNNIDISGNYAQSSGGSGYNFYGNSSQGGAMYARDTCEILNNGNVNIINNYTSASSSSSDNSAGGAIYAANIVIAGNSKVFFEKNYEILDSSYRLRSIYSLGETILSSPDGCFIEFYDSIYSRGIVSINYDYLDQANLSHKATGDIIFSGKYTEAHIKELKGKAGSATEIANSRTSELLNTVNLYGGTLRVEDKAVLKTHAINVTDGSNATMKVTDAEVNTSSYDITVNKTGTLEIAGTDGSSKITANNINIEEGATLSLTLTEVVTENVAIALSSADSVSIYNDKIAGIVISSNLNIAGGATLKADGAHLSMDGGILNFLATTENKTNLVLTFGAEYDPNSQIMLFSDVDTVKFLQDSITATSNSAMVSLNASDYFTGDWVNDKTTLVYDSGNIYVSGVNVVIPEPATTTLSLLALAALAARRRRK